MSLYIKQIWLKRLAEHHARTKGFQKAQIFDGECPGNTNWLNFRPIELVGFTSLHI